MASGAAGAGGKARPPPPGPLSDDLAPWEDKLAALMPGGREDIWYLAKSSKLLYKAGWRDKPSSTHPESDYTYYSPEGDRKRLLPLPLRRGRDVFETRNEWLGYIFERMHRYFDAKERRNARANFDDVTTPVHCTASSAVVMAGVPQQNRSKNKVMWPARLATAEEAQAYRAEHGPPLTDATSISSSKNRRDDGPGNVVIVVLLCWGTHHVLAAVKKEYCRRVTPEELEAMLALWMNEGISAASSSSASSSAEERTIRAGSSKTASASAPTTTTSNASFLGRELKDTQLSVEFVAGLAYAAAFARLAKRGGAGGGLVSTQRGIRNEEGVVPGFGAAELDDPWTALERQQTGVVAVVGGGGTGQGEEGDGGKDARRLFPELGACEECVADHKADRCDGPAIMARALRHLQRERGHRFPPHVLAAAGRKKLWGEGEGLVSDDSGQQAQPQLPAQKRARVVGGGGEGVGGFYPRSKPAAAASAVTAGGGGAVVNGGAVDMASGEGEEETEAAMPMEEAEEGEGEELPVVAKEFREAWSTLLGQAVLVGAWQGEGQEPLAVRAVVGAVAPLLERAEQGMEGVNGEGEATLLASAVSDLEWAHKVVAAGVGSLGDKVREGVGRRWAEVERLQAECWAVVATTPLARDVALVGMVAARRAGWEGAAVEGLVALASASAAGTEGGVVGMDEGKEGSSPVPPAPSAKAMAAAAAAAERLKPLARALANARSLLEAGRGQVEDAAKVAWGKWGRLRRGLLAAARTRAGLGGVNGEGKTLLLYDARCAHHRVPEAHVEQPVRFLEASEAMRALAKEHPGRFLLKTEIGEGGYFPLWRGAAEGFAPEVLRAHTVSHLDALRLRCQKAGSTITRLSVDAPNPPAPLPAVPTSSARMQRRSSSTGLGLSASSAAAAAAAASLPSPGHHYHGHDAGAAWQEATNAMDGDTFGTRASFIAASVGFAASLQAVDEVVSGRARNAFVACRPPGHHAGRNGKPMLPADASVQARDVGWGFCFLNYVAGAALHAVEKWGLSRVTVIDFDLHHGNGTEEILTAQRSSAFQFISLHAADIFPHTGQSADPSRFPHLVNIPIPAPLTPSKYRRAWAQVDAAVDAFAPDLILLSAGYDAHINDPIGARAFVGKLAPAGRLTSGDFHDLVARVRNLANRHCLGRMVGVMEGGYCCRPPEEMVVGEGGEEGEEDEQDLLGEEDGVAEETVKHCVAATCKAMAGL